MLYQSYREKLERGVRVLDKLWRLKYVILAALAALIALIIVLCAISGNIYGESCPSSVEYGTPLDLRAKAIFGSVTAEHREQGTQTWQPGAPRRVGEYEVRAVSHSAVGEKYGTVFSCSVVPHALAPSLPESFVYGDEPVIGGAFAQGDRLETADFTYSALTPYRYEVTAQVRAIVNEAGEDVTDCYTFSPVTAEMEMLPRDVTIVCKSAEKVYDGTPLSMTEYSMPERQPAAGDTFSFEWPSRTDAGEIRNYPDVTALNAQGEDVSGWYVYTFEVGTLTVLPRPVTVQAGSAEKIYDAEPLYAIDYHIDESTPVADGHTLDVLEYASRTDAGVSENLPVYAVYDAEGSDVTANYVFESGSGTLTVLPRPVTVWTASRTWIYYDGAEFSAADAGDYGVSARSEYPLAKGHMLLPTPDSVRENTLDAITDLETEVRYVDNCLAFSVLDDSGVDVSGNYTLTYEYGKLRVKTEIIVTLVCLSKFYDGTALAFTEGDYSIVKPPDVEASCVLPSLTDAGSVALSDLSEANVRARDPATGRDVMSENRCRFRVDGAGWDVTVLEVRPRPITVTSISLAAKNEGQPLYGNVSGGAWISFGSLLSGHRIEIEVTGVLWPTQLSAYNEIGSVVIYDAYGRDVSANYNISIDRGWLQWL